MEFCLDHAWLGQTFPILSQCVVFDWPYLIDFASFLYTLQFMLLCTMQAWPEDMRQEDPGGSVKWQARDYSAAVTRANKALRHEHTKQKAPQASPCLSFACFSSCSPAPTCPSARLDSFPRPGVCRQTSNTLGVVQAVGLDLRLHLLRMQQLGGHRRRVTITSIT